MRNQNFHSAQTIFVKKVELPIDAVSRRSRVQFDGSCIFQYAESFLDEHRTDSISSYSGINQHHPNPTKAMFVTHRSNCSDHLIVNNSNATTVRTELKKHLPVAVHLIPATRTAETQSSFNIRRTHLTKVHSDFRLQAHDSLTIISRRQVPLD